MQASNCVFNMFKTSVLDYFYNLLKYGFWCVLCQWLRKMHILYDFNVVFSF